MLKHKYALLEAIHAADSKIELNRRLFNPIVDTQAELRFDRRKEALCPM